MILLLGLILGVILGLLFNLQIPDVFNSYAAVIILATLLSIIRGYRAYFNQKFDVKFFLLHFIGNLILAVGLSYLGEILNIELYYAVLIYFVIQIFQNFSIIKIFFLNKS